MSITVVDTFEKNIAEEIKHKDATYSEIVAATSDKGAVEPTPPDVHRTSPVFIISGVLAFLAIVGIGVMSYLYQAGSFNPVAANTSKATVAQPTTQEEPKGQLSTLSSTLEREIGSYVTNVQKSNNGYLVRITTYGPVFAYMTRNESSYIEDFASKVYIPSKSAFQKAAATPKITTPITGTSTNASSTQATSTEQETSSGPYFTDVTISNQNMRVWNYASGTVVYAFIGTKAFAVSSSTDGILQLRNQLSQK